MLWPDVHVANDWHSNPERVLVSVVPTFSRTRTLEIHRLRVLLPDELVHDPTFVDDSLY